MKMEPANFDLPPEILKKLLDNASACAVALLLVGADQFTVDVGDLSRRAFDQMRRAMNKYWPVSTHHNLNRYIGLDLDEEFYFLFAKFLPQSDYLLSLVFKPQTPLVRIRQDMTNMMRHVLQRLRTQMPKSEGLEQSLQFVHKPYPVHESEGLMPTTSTRERAEIDDKDRRFKGEAVPDQNNMKPPESTPEWRPVSNASNLNATASDQRIDDPQSGEGWLPLDEILASRENPSSKEVTVDDGSSGSDPSFRYSMPPEKDSIDTQRDWQPLEEASEPDPDLVRLFHEDFDLQSPPSSPSKEDFKPAQPSGEYAQTEPEFYDEETRPNLVDTGEEFDQIKLSDITFYLVPSEDSHYLLGELPKKMREWFPDICETYGWQLDHLSVRPDYIKWRLGDFPDALIHEMLEIVRERTSERIFRVFPNMKMGDQTKDFWSPGYLVDRQNQDFSTQVLIAHVAKGRSQT